MAALKRPTVIVSESDHTRRSASWVLRLLLLAYGIRPRVVRHDGHLDRARGHDGLLIAGGEDVHPGLYGGVVAAARTTNTRRDRRELALLEDAERAGIPVLAICRGAQILNVHRGGSLYGDLSWISPGLRERRRVLDTRRALVHERSRLAGIVRSATVGTNSFHHQAVAHVGRDLEVSAQDLDGVTLAVEQPGDERFVVGVQWHPELLPWRPRQRLLFAAFADAVERAHLCKRVLAAR